MTVKVIQPGDESVIERWANRLAVRTWRILDVGGGEKPLRPATHVLDLLSYESRRVDEGRGPLPERFAKETWTEWDVNVTPWPFDDDYFDYVWCCQVVEDIRDPIAACKEMMRVGRAGFISTVHRSYESSVVQYDGVIGYHHHRWLVEAMQDGIVFTFKSPILQVDRAVRPRQASQWLLHWAWRGDFEVTEKFAGGDRGQRAELSDYLKRCKT
jgi:SAM-dependent methyltransferase